MNEQSLFPVVYLIHVLSRDGLLLPDAPLCRLRREFLTGGRPVKGKLQGAENGVPVKVWYRLSKRSFEWLKKSGKRVMQEACSEDYGWSLTTYAENGAPLSRARFGYGHQWLQTAYYGCPADSSSDISYAKPTLYLLPAGSGVSCLELDPATQEYRRSALVFFPVPEPAQNALLNGMFGEPDLVAETSAGRFYLCTPEDSARRSAFLAVQRNSEELFLMPEEPDELDRFVLIDNTQPDAPATQAVPEKHEPGPAAGAALLSAAPLEYAANHELSLFNDPELPASEEAGRAGPADTGPNGTPPQKYSVAACGLAGVVNAPGLTGEKAPGKPSETHGAAPAGQLQAEGSEEAPRPLDAKKAEDPAENPAPNTPAPTSGEPQPKESKAAEPGPAGMEGPLAPGAITAAKRIVVSARESYLYFGGIAQGLREGRGRTQMANGCTAYEGGYRQDKRDGFGAYYYKSGKPCYIGNWRQNKRQGLGVAFSARDGSLFVGNWENNIPTGRGTAFDENGQVIYSGEWKDGKRHGQGTEYADGKAVYCGEWREDQRVEGYCLFKAEQTEDCDEKR